MYEILTIQKNELLVYFTVTSSNLLYTVIAKTSEILEVAPFFQVVTFKIDKPISKSLWFLCKVLGNRELLLQPLALLEKKLSSFDFSKARKALSVLFLKPF